MAAVEQSLGKTIVMISLDDIPGVLCGLVSVCRVDHEGAFAADKRLSIDSATGEAFFMLPTRGPVRLCLRAD
jgi:hypothetical protein